MLNSRNDRLYAVVGMLVQVFLSNAHTMNNDDNDVIPTVTYNDDHLILKTISISIDTYRSGVNGFGKYLESNSPNGNHNGNVLVLTMVLVMDQVLEMGFTCLMMVHYLGSKFNLI